MIPPDWSNNVTVTKAEDPALTVTFAGSRA